MVFCQFTNLLINCNPMFIDGVPFYQRYFSSSIVGLLIFGRKGLWESNFQNPGKKPARQSNLSIILSVTKTLQLSLLYIYVLRTDNSVKNGQNLPISNLEAGPQYQCTYQIW